MKRRDWIAGSLATAFSSAMKLQAAGVLPGFFPGLRAGRLRGVHVGTPVPLADNSGDTWVAAWASDGNLYSPSDDTSGFHKATSANVAFNRIDGDDPPHLSGVTVNSLEEYGK